MEGFEFYCKIHKKPRGNWRPKCHIRVRISTSAFPHRPKLEPIRILGKYEDHAFLPQAEGVPLGRYFASEEIRHYPVFDLLEPYTYVAEGWSGRWGVWIDSGIYDSPRKDDMEYVYRSTSVYWKDVKYCYSYAYLIPRTYIDPDNDPIEIDTFFYLDWRPGAHPDYSDIAEQLSIIPTLVSIMLLDGADSGENDEIIITRQNVKISKVKNKNSVEVRRKIRV